MNTYQAPEGRTSVDDLLGESGMTPAEQAALRVLLAPVAAPASPAELRGETAALAAFRSARPALAPKAAVVRSRPAPRMRLARAMSIKAAIAAITVAGMGGVAVAASTGSLPGPLDGPRHNPAKIQPAQEHPGNAKPGDAGSKGSAQLPAVVPPGQAVSEATKGARQRELVQERNAQRRQAQREELLAEREERLARQEQRREEQAGKKLVLTESQAERGVEARVEQRKRPLPQSERNADKANR